MTRILLIVFITILVIAFFIFYQRRASEYNGGKKSDFEEKLERDRKEREEKRQKKIEAPENLSYGRVILRPSKLLDKKPLAIILNDRRVVHATDFERVKRVKEMERILEADYIDVIGAYTVEVLNTENVIGLARIDDGPAETSRRLTLLIGHQYWRHGFGREALKALSNKAREEGAEKLEFVLATEDENANAFLKASGFEREGLVYSRLLT